MQAEAQTRYVGLRDKPAEALCGSVVGLHMNAGLMADLPSLVGSGAEGVGLFRTELQFLIRNHVPKRSRTGGALCAGDGLGPGKRVVFRTLDIGSDKVLPYMKRPDEPNPAMGWRAVRVGLDKPGVMRMQMQALIRAAARPAAVGDVPDDRADRRIRRCPRPDAGTRSSASGAWAMPCPSGARDRRDAGNPVDGLRAGRVLRGLRFHLGRRQRPEAVLLRRRPRERTGPPPLRHAATSRSSASCAMVVGALRRRPARALSFCGEDAGRPVEAVALAALGFRTLSMRPASIGPVKSLIRRVDLDGAEAGDGRGRGGRRRQPAPGGAGLPAPQRLSRDGSGLAPSKPSPEAIIPGHDQPARPHPCLQA